MQDTPKVIFLKDLYLSAFLKAKNFPLHDAKLDGQGRTIFYFEETLELSKTVKDFYSGTALVNPSNYIEAFKNLRTLAYSLSGDLNRKKYGEPQNEFTNHNK